MSVRVSGGQRGRDLGREGGLKAGSFNFAETSVMMHLFLSCWNGGMVGQGELKMSRRHFKPY